MRMGFIKVAFIDLNTPVGTTGDPVSVVVTDASGKDTWQKRHASKEYRSPRRR